MSVQVFFFMSFSKRTKRNFSFSLRQRKEVNGYVLSGKNQRVMFIFSLTPRKRTKRGVLPPSPLDRGM